MNHSIHSADRRDPPEDRGRRPRGRHCGCGFRHFGPDRFGLQPDCPGREGGQGGGRHQREHLDGPLSEIEINGIKTAALGAAFLRSCCWRSAF